MARNNPSLQLAALATVAVRGLDVVATRPPQTTTADYRYCGVLDDKGRHWVVQAPLHASAASALDAEVPILTELDVAAREDRIGFSVIRPDGFAPLPEGGWRAMAYQELPGREMDLDNLTPGPGPTVSLAQAIAQIHELPHDVLDRAGAPVFDADSYRRRRLAEVDAAARTSTVPPVLLARWEHALEDTALWAFHPTCVHGDLAPENVLMSNGAVVGIVNWSNAHVGDPAKDLAWLYAAAPEESLDTLDEAYAVSRAQPPDPHMGSRATLYSELAVARWLLHGVRLDDPEIVSDAEGMLAALARNVADSAPIGRTAHDQVTDDPTPVGEWSVTGTFGADTDAETDADVDAEGWLDDDEAADDPDATGEIPAINPDR